MLRMRVLGGAAFDTAGAGFGFSRSFGWFGWFRVCFFCFCVMSLNLAVKKKKVFGGMTAENLIVCTDTIVPVTLFIILRNAV